MIEFSEARRTALDYVRNLSVGLRIELVLVDEATSDEGWCWVFAYDSRAHLESGDSGDALLGLSPLVVIKETGMLQPLSSTPPPDDALALLRLSAEAPVTAPVAVGESAGATAATGPPRPAPIPLGLTRAVPVDGDELAATVRQLGLPPPAPLSPLPDLSDGRPTDGATARGPTDPGRLLEAFQELPEATVRNALLPLVVPDRVVEARAGLFDSAPSPCRLYTSRRAGGVFAGLRPTLDPDRAHELLAPYSTGDLTRWVQSQLQFSAGAPIPPPQEELDAAQLAFLLALIDAYKTRFFRSFAGRRSTPTPLALSCADVLEAQEDALLVADRRWLTRTLTELFALLAHPGGRTGVTLPPVTEEFAERELLRYAEAGHLERTGTAAEPRYTPSLAFSVFAGTLFTWTVLLALHDVQLTGWEDGRAAGQEELLLFVVTQPALWTLLSDGLTEVVRTPEPDWSRARFALRSLDLADAAVLTDDFLRPLPVEPLPDEIYAPVAARASAPGPAPAVSPEAPTEVRRSEPGPVPASPPTLAATRPPWQPTHQVPADGMPAWAEPDPNRAPVARIDARVELQILERAGDWAHIICSNGWSAWVDGRVMEPLR
ncbi:YrhB domain-containing protein [Streptomyces wedmorensis]|uniref:YrhB domain-containing protein n=1 Tax=Streptomyces wedmorensis TaxID=43759 RepID=UPI003412A93C